MRKVFITTVDNPYDPDTQYDKWRQYDEDKGYYTSEYLGRIAVAPENLGPNEYWKAVEDAIDEIISFQWLYRDKQLYKKVIKEVNDDENA